MRPLFDYIEESLKKVGEFRGGIRKDDASDIIQITERSFKEGSLSEQEMVKLILSDVKDCFKLPDSKLNKEYDDYIEKRAKEEVDSQIDKVKKLAERQYKTQKRRDQYVAKELDEIRNKVFKYNTKYTIDRVDMQLNPISMFAGHAVAKDGGSKQWGDFVLGGDTEERLVEWLNEFGYRDSNGEEVNLRKHIIGWEITYCARQGTKCPKYNSATLKLKLTKDGQAIVNKYNKSRDDAIGAYYAEKGSGGYTGD